VSIQRSRRQKNEATGEENAVAGTVRALRGPSREVGAPDIGVRGTRRAAIYPVGRSSGAVNGAREPSRGVS